MQLAANQPSVWPKSCQSVCVAQKFDKAETGSHACVYV